MSKAYTVSSTYSIYDGCQISVEQLLAARELRANIQRMLINKYQFPILSLTLVIPGKIKQSSAVNFLFDEAVTVVLNNFWGVINKITCYLMTGPESFFIISGDAMMQKKQCIELENTHPLGRLWDLDVICPIQMTAISRKQCGYGVRGCLLCELPAKVCARNQTHDIQALLYVIEQKIMHYVNQRSIPYG